MPVLSAKEMEGIDLPSPGPREYWEDSKWASEHFTEIVKEYPNQWVAIADKKVVAAGRTIAEVKKKPQKRLAKMNFPYTLPKRESVSTTIELEFETHN